ncbi:MAG: hypothetical protein ACRC51_03495 [Cetobacterium sp.]
MLFRLFKSKKEELLKKENELLMLKLNEFKINLKKKENLLNCKNNLIIKRDDQNKKNQNWETMEKELQKYYSENKELKTLLTQAENIFGWNYLKNSYLISVDKYFSEAKFKESLEIFKRKGIYYVQDLNEFVIQRLSVEDKLKKDIFKKYLDFLDLNINWELKTSLLKGEKVTKIYQKNRKFLKLLQSKNIEYMSNLEKFNFDLLLNENYSLIEIHELEEKYTQYILKNKKTMFEFSEKTENI